MSGRSWMLSVEAQLELKGGMISIVLEEVFIRANSVENVEAVDHSRIFLQQPSHKFSS